MNVSRREYAIAVVLLLAVSVSVRAQTPIALTIDEAVARALAGRARVAEAAAREAAASAAVAGRAALRQPALSVSSGVLRTNHVEEFGVPQAGGTTRIIFPDLPNNYRARAELAVPLYTAGRVDALVRAAEADRRAAAADRRTVEADIALEARRAYWALVLARETVGVLDRARGRGAAAPERPAGGAGPARAPERAPHPGAP